MSTEYWFVRLPTSNPRLKGENRDDQLNRELTELVERGWEPISMIPADITGGFGFLFKATHE